MWTKDGVVAGIDYPHSFHPELAPAHLVYALALAGFRAPFEWGREFRYAELGCGQGLTANLLAALHPEGRFEAIDALPAHMAQARRLAASAGLDNVRFAAETFAEFAARPQGEDVEIIALHGVWTWVAPEHRAQLADIARRRLKPGGVLYVSYNCLPGWEPDLMVRRLLLAAVEQAPGTLPERIAAGLDHLDRLAWRGDFDHAPSSLRLLRSLRGKSDGYIAHEFLNRHWQPFHPAEVAAQLAPLQYVGSATLADHLFPPGPECRFRRDLFVKAPARLPEGERRAVLASQRFGLVVPPAQVPASLIVGGAEIAIESTLVDALPACAAGVAAPLPPEDPVRAARCARFNAAVLEANRTDSAIRQLASPVLATGIMVDLLDRLFLLAEQDGADPAAFACDRLRAWGQRLRRDGEALDGEEALVEARRLYEVFRRGRREWLRAQGV